MNTHKRISNEAIQAVRLALRHAADEVREFTTSAEILSCFKAVLYLDDLAQPVAHEPDLFDRIRYEIALTTLPPR